MSGAKGVEFVLRKQPIVRITLSLLGLVFLAFLVSGIGCKSTSERRTMSPDVESAIGTVSADIEAERYEKIYQEASDLWRRDSTTEQSAEVFKTLRSKLGKVASRTLHSAIEQSNSGGPLKGEVYIVTYQTEFEHGEGMETYTLIKQDGNWKLARYLVNSTNLK